MVVAMRQEHNKTEETKMAKSTVDPLYENIDLSSLSNPNEVLSTNIKLEWDVDFDKQIINGLVEHTIQIIVEGAPEVSFDTSNLTILAPVLVDGEVVNYSLSPLHPTLGTKLTISIPASKRAENTTCKVAIAYTVSPSASAMQWLTPELTKGGKFPYVFTQSQAIHARSLLPCMDSPGVKTPYSAIVTAPSWCTVLMSAVQSDASTVTPISPSPLTKAASTTSNTFYWNQPVPTSAYLIAMAGGNLASREVSDRVRIWSEPEVIESAHYEFAETEEFLKAAEDITGCPYQWGRYDVLCLPPSFPYGGMENPCLTFATPTLLAGDRSLADVIAHEIAHSWTGNLVTNVIWNHFWLNEGWTVWLERKITSKCKKNVEVGKLSAQINLVHLSEDIERMGTDHQFTQMVWPLHGEDPDDAFSSVPYEKGFNLLNYLEGIVGTALFESFAKAYINEFKFRTVTTGGFRDFFVNFINESLSSSSSSSATGAAASNGTEGDSWPYSGSGAKGKKGKKGKKAVATSTNTTPAKPTADPAANANTEAILNKIQSLDWNHLFLSRGMPTYEIDFSNSLSTAVDTEVNKWLADRNKPALQDPTFTKVARKDLDKQWSSQQKCLFLEQLIAASSAPNESFSVAYLTNINSAFNFQVTFNAEITLRWQTLCIKNNVPWVYDNVVRFLTTQGRMKFVRPLYRLLRASSIGGPKVVEVFEANKHRYHPIARKMIEQDLARIAASEATADPEPASLPAAVAPAVTAPAVVVTSAPITPAAVEKTAAASAPAVAVAAAQEVTSAPAAAKELTAAPGVVVPAATTPVKEAPVIAVAPVTPSTPSRAVEEPVVAASTPTNGLSSTRSAEDVVHMLQETAKAAQALVKEAEKVVKVAEKISSPQQSPVRVTQAAAVVNGEHGSAPSPLSAPAPTSALVVPKHQPEKVIELSNEELEPKREQTVSKINNGYFFAALAAGVALGAFYFIRFRGFR